MTRLRLPRRIVVFCLFENSRFLQVWLSVSLLNGHKVFQHQVEKTLAAAACAAPAAIR